MVNDDISSRRVTSPSAVRSPRRRRARLAGSLLAVLTLLGVAACSTSTGSRGTPGASVATTGESSPFAHLGAVPKTVDGATFDAASLTGRPVVLWFWAPWCTICRGEAPTVAKIAAEFDGQVEFVGVAGLDTVSAMAQFVEQTGTGDITHLADTDGTIWREYGVAVQPAFAFITSDGRADVRVGSLGEAALRARVVEVAAGAATSTVSATPGPTCSKAADGTLLCGSAGPGQPSTPAGAGPSTRSG